MANEILTSSDGHVGIVTINAISKIGGTVDAHVDNATLTAPTGGSEGVEEVDQRLSGVAEEADLGRVVLADLAGVDLDLDQPGRRDRERHSAAPGR